MNSAPGATDAPEGDRGQLRRPFRSLLEDAVAHGGDGPPRIRVSAVRDRDRWRVSVADEGSDIDFEDTDRSFERPESVDGSNGTVRHWLNVVQADRRTARQRRPRDLRARGRFDVPVRAPGGG